jgi:hypothetical protein
MLVLVGEQNMLEVDLEVGIPYSAVVQVDEEEEALIMV